MVLDIHLKIIDLDCGDIHPGICPISSAEWHGKKITGCHSVLQNSINTAEYSLMLNSFCSPKQPITILRTHLKPRLHHCTKALFLPSPFNSQDLNNNSPYCVPYSSCDVSLENLVLVQLITPNWSSIVFILITSLPHTVLIL